MKGLQLDNIKVGDRVRNSLGKEGVVFQTGMTGPFHTPSSVRVAGVEYDDGTKRDSIYADALMTVITEEPIHAGDRVRHNGKVLPDLRRLGGSVLSVGGRYALIQWDGLRTQREELVSQLEVVHRPETPKDAHPAQAILDVLDTERTDVQGKIAVLQEYLDVLDETRVTMAKLTR